MSQFGGGGQFGGSAFNNPQMNPNWFNPNNQQTQWEQSFIPDQANWQNYFNPNSPGAMNYYNPGTGEFTQNMQPGTGIYTGNFRQNGANMLSWVDPETGHRFINPNAMSGMFGGQQQASYGGFNPSEFEQPQIQAPDAWGGYNWDAQEMIDPSEVIAAQEYKLQEAMDADMAKAGARLGQSGMAMSTPYAGAVADSARRAAQDRNALTLQYQYQAATDAARRQQAQQMADAQMEFGGWQTGGGWDMSAQQQNAQNAFNKWMAENQWAFQDRQAQNDWNMGRDAMQNNFLASMIGGLF